MFGTGGLGFFSFTEWLQITGVSKDILTTTQFELLFFLQAVRNTIPSAVEFLFFLQNPAGEDLSDLKKKAQLFLTAFMLGRGPNWWEIPHGFYVLSSAGIAEALLPRP